MKRWYIITADKEYLCKLVMLSATSKTLTMKYEDKQFKVRIHDFKRDYPAAKSGDPVIAKMVSSKNRSINKPVKIVFK